MKTTRRKLIKNSITASAMLSFFGRGSFIQNAAGQSATPTPPFILHIVCNGGWDPAIVFNDQTGGNTVATMTGATPTTGGGSIPYVSHSTMPNTSNFFSSQGSNAAIVNGVRTYFAEHNQALLYHLTADTPKNFRRGVNQRTSFLSYYGHIHNPGKTIPHLAIDGIMPGGAFDISSYFLNAELIASASNAPPNTTTLSDAAEAALTSYFGNHYSRSLGNYASTGLDAEKINNLALGYMRDKTVKSNLSSMLSNIGSTSSDLELNIKLALEFAAAEFSLCATVQTSDASKWDSHSNNHTRQAASFEELFSAINAGISYAQSKDLASKLIILVTSEMGRTPSLNSSSGKEHWPYSSALIWSELISGGKTINATDEYLRAKKVDIATGKSDNKNGEILTIEHLFSTLFYITDTPSEGFVSSSKILSPLV